MLQKQMLFFHGPIEIKLQDIGEIRCQFIFFG